MGISVMDGTKSPIVWVVDGVCTPKPIEIKFILRNHQGRIDVLASHPDGLTQTVCSFRDGGIQMHVLAFDAAKKLGILLNGYNKMLEV